MGRNWEFDLYSDDAQIVRTVLCKHRNEITRVMLYRAFCYHLYNNNILVIMCAFNEEVACLSGDFVSRLNFLNIDKKTNKYVPYCPDEKLINVLVLLSGSRCVDGTVINTPIELKKKPVTQVEYVSSSMRTKTNIKWCYEGVNLLALSVLLGKGSEYWTFLIDECGADVVQALDYILENRFSQRLIVRLNEFVCFVFTKYPNFVSEKDGRTCLHWAVGRHYKMSVYAEVSMLIKNGADVNARDKDGLTPLFYVRTADVAQLLVQHGADTNVCVDGISVKDFLKQSCGIDV